MSPFCIPTRAPMPTAGNRWVHEIKHDGYRLMARREGDRVILRTRGGYDWSERYSLIVRSVTHSVAIPRLDGGVAVLRDGGIGELDALHSRKVDASATLLAFDLLEIDGTDLRALPLLERNYSSSST